MVIYLIKKLAAVNCRDIKEWFNWKIGRKSKRLQGPHFENDFSQIGN